MALAITVGANPSANARRAALTLGVHYQTAWELLNQIRTVAAMAPLASPDDEPPEFVIGQNRYIGGGFYSTRTWWTNAEKTALDRFVKGGFAPAVVAPVLGRSPTSIAHYARDRKLILPKEWAALITPRRTASPSRERLSYPYIITPRDEKKRQSLDAQ